MSIATTRIEKQVKAFCALIGADPLLVQGAGGNVSWKDGDALWVKASGTWLAEAELKDIFVPVNLSLLQAALSKYDFSVKPEVTSDSNLRPSIETLLHALMPHRVVVHLHAVEILAHLVQVNAKEKIKNLVGDSVKWIYVDYFKPGADLARAVSEQLTNRFDADVVFLGNHGVVIGGRDVEEVDKTLTMLTTFLRSKSTSLSHNENYCIPMHSILEHGYTPVRNSKINQLATHEEFFSRLKHDWALYPDHVVFLGAKAAVIESNNADINFDYILEYKPPFIFVFGQCVYKANDVTAAQEAQLHCYLVIMMRQNCKLILYSLSKHQIFELLTWDLEKYRQKAAKKNIVQKR